MKIKRISIEEFHRVKPIIIQFIRKYGNDRITYHAIRWFSKLEPKDILEATLIAVALDNQKKVTGVIVFGNYGIDESFITVHPEYRQQKIGEILLNYSLKYLSKVYTRVACDNTPSLKLCFNCDLVAFCLIKGPTGKPTLWLAGGKWNKEDIKIEQPPNNDCTDVKNDFLI
jgi:GNAT superfamily N-acetyltransferase